jgi:hypothetical protein
MTWVHLLSRSAVVGWWWWVQRAVDSPRLNYWFDEEREPC